MPVRKASDRRISSIPEAIPLSPSTKMSGARRFGTHDGAMADEQAARRMGSTARRGARVDRAPLAYSGSDGDGPVWRFSHGMAALVELDKGRTVFAKAIPGDDALAVLYRTEADTVAQLPVSVPGLGTPTPTRRHDAAQR